MPPTFSPAIRRPSVSTPALLSPKEVATQLSVTVRALERWRARSVGPAFVRLTRKTVRYPAEAVASFLASLRPPSGTAPA